MGLGGLDDEDHKTRERLKIAVEENAKAAQNAEEKLYALLRRTSEENMKTKKG
jgi:hypothetical protein